MRLLLDFLPIALFFLAYKLYGIYVATGVAIAASALQLAYMWLHHKKVEKSQLITLITISVLGGATLIFHNDMFIKWKPTVIYSLFAASFFASGMWAERTLIQRLMDEHIELPPQVWLRMNTFCGLFFASMGLLNTYVIYHYSTDGWVHFKLFGTLGLTLAFVLVLGWYVSRMVSQQELGADAGDH